jgi:VanZ family protein
MKLQPWACGLFWLAALSVLVLSLLPGQYLPQGGPLNFWDKAQHATAFAVLTGLGQVAWPRRPQRALLILGLICFGGAIEIAQHMTSWRFGEWTDWAADLVGIATLTITRIALFDRRRA